MSRNLVGQFVSSHASLADAFWDGVRVEDQLGDGCWHWQGRKSLKGYGAFWYKRKHYTAHRASYALLVGAIPEGLMVCHRCDVRDCVNPSHLFLGTNQDNMEDMKAKGRQGQAKLDKDRVATIRSLYYTGSYSYADLADLFAVTRSNIGCIVRGVSWNHKVA